MRLAAWLAFLAAFSQAFFFLGGGWVEAGVCLFAFLAGWLVGWLVGCWLVGWLGGSLVRWLVRWLVGWLVGRQQGGWGGWGGRNNWHLQAQGTKFSLVQGLEQPDCQAFTV